MPRPKENNVLKCQGQITTAVETEYIEYLFMSCPHTEKFCKDLENAMSTYMLMISYSTASIYCESLHYSWQSFHKMRCLSEKPVNMVF